MKIVKSLLVAAVAALTLVSCQNKEAIKPLKETRKVHFVVNSSAPQTKSYIDNQLDGTYNVGWNAEDELAIFFGTVSKDNSDKADAIFTNTSEKGETASFEGDAEVESTEGTFLSFYPASALAKTYNGTVGVTVKDCQEPTYDSFDPSCDILVARPCTYLADEDEIVINDLYFTRIMSVLKVNLVSSFEEISDDIVKNFKMEVPSDYILTGRPAVNLETAEISQWNIKNSYVEAKFNNNDVKVNTELENSVYLIVNPVTLASGSDLAFSIETENYNITKNARLSKDMVFRQGNISVINLNITELDCEPKAAPKTIPYEEDFTKSAGSFTIENVSLGDITYVWSPDNTYGFKASAFVNKAAHETESWIVSPIIDLSNASGAVLTFDQALNNLKDGDREDFVDVLIKVYGQDWETLSIDAYPAGSDWNFITSSANLYPFIGSKIKVGFKYTSSSSIAPTWEIKNFSVKEPVTTMSFANETVSIFAGDTFDNPANTNSPATISYVSSNSSVATVDESGTITGVSAGTCTITASVVASEGYPSKSVVCNVTINAASTDQWVKTAIADIYPTAKVVIVGGGYAMTNDNGTTAPAAVAVAVTTKDNKLTSVVSDNICWSIGGNATDGYTFYPFGDTSMWLYVSTTASSGSNNNIKVGAPSTNNRNLFVPDDSGYFKTKDSYTARYLSVYKDTPDWRGYVNTSNNPVVLEFYVLDGTNTEPTTVAVTGVELNESSLDLTVGDEETLVATVKPSNATNKGVNWSSNNKAIATVGADGKVTAIAAGTATITVSTIDGSFTATCEVKVVEGEHGDVSTESIDFESAESSYTFWTFTNIVSKQTGTITAHGGTNYGTTNSKTTGSIATKNTVASPKSITVFVSKQSSNTTASEWKIQVSNDGINWTNVASQSASSMNKGTWVEFTANLSSYSNVYVRVYYDGTSAVRDIDDLTLIY